MLRLGVSAGVAVPLLVIGLLVVHACSVSADQVQRARELTDEGWWDEAEELLLGLLEEDRSNPEIYNNLAEIYLSRLARGQEVDWGDMEKYAKKAVELDKTNASYYITLGDILGIEAQRGNKLRAMGRAKDGRKAIESALAIDPDNIEAREWLLNYYVYAPGFAGGDKDKARVQAEEIAEIDGVEGNMAWALIYEDADENYEAAEAEYLKALSAEPDEPRPYFAYAYFCSRRGEDDKARSIAMELLEKEWIDDATRTRVHMDLGFMYQGSEEWEKAAAEFTKSLEADSTEMRAVYQLGRTYIFAESNLDEAERHYILYLSQPRLKGWWPARADAHYRLAMVYNLKGEKEAASREVEEALKLNPDHKGAKDLKRDIVYGRN